ncbi:hypothetical protein LLEC1_00682 [Akanthomyces lecanii]|uniref:Heparan-alpha-glucosaminide N-acetyltransferase catalytic domain-containing protein n=1 Tax=Cordyceps confragosa TaxID=2714763 RepID=A0A179IGP9_CORDF|nr:hypothetical protein LLEC1_00682 [Akanthomyces lecanii]
MSHPGSAGNGNSGGHAATSDNAAEASRRRSTIPHYNSFPSYNAIQHETSSGYGTVRQAAAGGKLQTRVLGPDLLRGLLMMFMAMDHLGMALRPWEHGLGKYAEQDGVPVDEWNRTAGYLVRSLTHLCAPGFTLLLGMGVVYLGVSRRAQGWGAPRLLRYFALRMAVLTVVMVAHGVLLTAGQLWFLNIVLFALAVDYFLTGAVWLAVDAMETKLAGLLATAVFVDEDAARSHDSDSDAEQPLLHAGRPLTGTAEAKAARVSWHVQNLLLAVLSVVTIFWNIWLSEDQGQCAVTTSGPPDAASAATDWDDREMDTYWWLRLWFWQANGPGVLSAFPPLAWLSFAITPENRAHPTRSQYLVSPAAFFYTIKYPPDVAFWALTLSANILLMAALGRVPVNFARNWLVVVLDFGTTSLFFYVVHMPVVFVTGWAMCTLFGHETDQKGPSSVLVSDKVIDNAFGFFGVWVLCLLIMWPLCRWYGQFKFGKPSDSLWRIF